MQENDISIMIGQMRFNFRVAIILYNGDDILLQKNKNTDYWILTGGRVKCGEDTMTAVKRETFEEVGIKIENPKLITVIENFYEYSDFKNHELLFIYKSEVKDKDLLSKQDFKVLDNDKITFHWFNKKEINSLVLKPKLMYQIFNNDLDNLTHFINIG